MYSGTQLYKFESPGKVSPADWDCFLPRKEGQTKFLILSDQWPLSNSQQEMLSKLVEAVNLKPDEAWIAAFPLGFRTNFHQLSQNIPLKKIVGIGIKPEQLSIHAQFEPYSPIELNDIGLIFTHSIDQLEPNKALRTSLWEALKVMFKLK